VREIFTMWRHTQMVVLVALSAAIYAAFLIVTQGLVIIPGFTNLRPGNVFPFVFGLLFGPAGAWGAAIGNLINDFFGTLGLGSIAGFVGNFFLGFLPYKMWGAFFRRGENMEQNTNSGKKLAVYVAIAILASIICAVWIAWFNDLLGNVPFTILASIISINNAIVGVVLGPILLIVLYPRVKRWGLLWTEIMEPDEVPASRLQTVGNILMWVGGIGALVVGLLLGSAAGGAPGGLGVGLGLIPFLIAIVVASFMLGGREQVEAVQEETITAGRGESRA
jgi:energy-coupling factor transport system substrate-specific component